MFWQYASKATQQRYGAWHLQLACFTIGGRNANKQRQWRLYGYSIVATQYVVKRKDGYNQSVTRNGHISEDTGMPIFSYTPFTLAIIR